MAIAGIMEIKGLAVKPIKKTIVMGFRHPTVRHAMRAPWRTSLHIDRLLGAIWRGATVTMPNATTIARNETAFTTKHQAGDPAASSSPASNGPITRPKLNCADDRDTAA